MRLHSVSQDSSIPDVRTYQVLLPLHPPLLRFHGDIVLHLPRQNCRHLGRTRGSIHLDGSSACEEYCHCQSILHWAGGFGTVCEMVHGGGYMEGTDGRVGGGRKGGRVEGGGRRVKAGGGGGGGGVE